MLIQLWDQLLIFLKVLTNFESIIWYVLLTSLVFRRLFPERGKSKKFLIVLACALILPVEVPRIAFAILTENCVNLQDIRLSLERCYLYGYGLVGANGLILLMPLWAKVFTKRVFEFEMGIGMWIFYYFIGVLIPKFFFHFLHRLIINII